jgi:hypothetical protein
VRLGIRPSPSVSFRAPQFPRGSPRGRRIRVAARVARHA